MGVGFANTYDSLHPDPNTPPHPNELKWGSPLMGGWVPTGLDRPTVEQGTVSVHPLSWYGDYIDFSRVGKTRVEVQNHFLRTFGHYLGALDATITEFAFSFAVFGVV